jgi:hypothetical protein
VCRKSQLFAACCRDARISVTASSRLYDFSATTAARNAVML